MLIYCNTLKVVFFHFDENHHLPYSTEPFLESFQYFQYQKRKLLWDESWIIPYENVHEGMIISCMRGLCVLEGVMISCSRGLYMYVHKSMIISYKGGLY